MGKIIIKRLLITLMLLAIGFTASANELADLRQRAEAGDAGAQFNLGGIYVTGEGVTQDYRGSGKMV